MDRLLVTGMDHVAGANIALALADRAEVLGCCAGPLITADHVITEVCTPHDVARLTDIVLEFQPQWIVHCSALALSSWDWPAADLELHDETRTATALAELAGRVGCRLTVLTSDAIFRGPRMFHNETSPADAPRAALLRDLEQALEATDALVVRSHVYGWSPLPEHACWAERIHQALVAGACRQPEGLRYATPLLATDLAELLWRANELRLHGLYHLAGAERTNPFRFAHELALACGLPVPRNIPHAASCDGTNGAVALDLEQETSLSSRRARRALEMTTPLLAEGLARFARQAVDGWRERWHVGEPAAQLCAQAA